MYPVSTAIGGIEVLRAISDESVGPDAITTAEKCAASAGKPEPAAMEIFVDLF